MNTALVQLNAELVESLGSFARWMNRPVARVQVYTWRLANVVFVEADHCFRALPAYRSANAKEQRVSVARMIKGLRAKRIKPCVPTYEEKSGHYLYVKA